MFVAPKMRPIFGCITGHLGVGVFYKKKKKGPILRSDCYMATPLVPNFKNIGVALPQAQNIIGACLLYRRSTLLTVLTPRLHCVERS